jgi:asparagine synthase (glutamine-hydrolysing)
MCGIAGILRVHPPGQPTPPAVAAIPEDWLDILDDSIKHRGPDGHGRFRDRAVRADGTTVDVALVHRRLSIIDHAGGAQPMVWGAGKLVQDGGFTGGRGSSPAASAPAGCWTSPLPDGRGSDELVAVVFNGCIYNHHELRRELQGAGHRFETDHADTEVLIHGWREWGPHIIERLDGMYAFAIWDRAKGELAVARDGFGEKPLHVLFLGGTGITPGRAFCSSVGGLVRLRHVANETMCGHATHLPALRGWIKYGWAQDPPIPGITQHGADTCSMLVEDVLEFGDPNSRRAPVQAGWRNLTFEPRDRIWTVEDAELALRAAVHTRLEADVPMGVFLSGGLDSSLVAAFAREVVTDLDAFTVRMPGRGFDESEYAAAVAHHLDVRHHILDWPPQARPSEDLPRLIAEAGVPFGDSSLLPSAWVSRAAREHVGVALGGDGGDEMFLGYERHRVVKLLSRLKAIPRPLRAAAARAITHGASATSSRTLASRLLNAAAHSGYKELTAIFPAPFDRELGLRPGPSDPYEMGADFQHFGTTPGDEASSLRFDLRFYLPDDLMRKADTASMSVALELRSPMLATRVAGEAMRASVSSLMPRGRRKGLLREVARRHLPERVLDLPKRGFSIPIGEWFRTDYGGMKHLLMDHLNSPDPWAGLGLDLNMKFVRRMLDEHLGTGVSGRVVRDHSQRLYMLLVLSIWAKWMRSIG